MALERLFFNTPPPDFSSSGSLKIGFGAPKAEHPSGIEKRWNEVGCCEAKFISAFALFDSRRFKQSLRWVGCPRSQTREWRTWRLDCLVQIERSAPLEERCLDGQKKPKCISVQYFLDPVKDYSVSEGDFFLSALSKRSKWSLMRLSHHIAIAFKSKSLVTQHVPTGKHKKNLELLAKGQNIRQQLLTTVVKRTPHLSLTLGRCLWSAILFTFINFMDKYTNKKMPSHPDLGVQ